MSQQKFAVFDIDGTIFRWQLYHEVFDAFVDSKLISNVVAEPVFAARRAWRSREISYSDYEQVLYNVAEQAIVGIKQAVFHSIANQILASNGQHVYRYTSNLLKKLKKEGYTLLAISASHHELVQRFAQLHQIDIAIGTRYDLHQGKLTQGKNEVFGNKDVILQQLVEKHQLSWEDSWAVGDSGSDIAMLRLVTHPIAFNPDKNLREMAMQEGWPIVVERKSLSYELEKGQDGTYILAETDSF